MGAALSLPTVRRFRPVRAPRMDRPQPVSRSVIDMARAMAAALAGSPFASAAEAVSLLRNAFPHAPLNARVAALGIMMEQAGGRSNPEPTAERAGD